MSSDAAFTVPKHRQPVTVRLDQGAFIEGDIFLEPTATELSPHQRMLFFLEEAGSFFPISIAGSGKTEFINKLNVLSLDVVLPADPASDFFAQALLHTIPVVITFTDNASLNGELTAEVPQEKGRLSDCLNLSGSVLCIRSEGRMCYINRAVIRKVAHAAAS
jgi:hypothetical protein